jgi:hypothetical protein
LRTCFAWQGTAWHARRPKRTPAFAALLVHIRDIRAELAQHNSRLTAVESHTAQSQSDQERGRLHEKIAEVYSLPELRLLSARMNVNHEDLDGSGLADTALALVMWAARHGRLQSLLAALVQERPHVCWSDYA